ncbi:amino acid adenylation domain-containing protein [Spirulina sp. CS-785/01]|uniref:amino acid adenylation domain-containing protein n=1 Tax=Spirulina sp. CS-785/01 TaxID=3021716 RepID=UPI00232B09B7|nr:amino acid adenylation domain-containing protein [Spirulina sp. CS-785/01]MDB9312398.1 amino acid adenylation domain-containing protein [Spirulina sp. CS-785/01]
MNTSNTSILPDPTLKLSNVLDKPIIQYFSEQSKRVPSQIALIDSRYNWNYDELEYYSNQLAYELQDKGINQGDIVAIYASRSAAFIWALLGILKAGAAFTILDSAYPNSRLLDCLWAANPKGLIYLTNSGSLPQPLDNFFKEKDSKITIELPDNPAQFQNKTATSTASESQNQPPKINIQPHDLAYISFTSGSTGKPKGIVGIHNPLTHFVKWQIEQFNLKESDQFVLLSGLSHDPILRDIFTPLCLGATLYIPDQSFIETPGKLARWMGENAITIAHLTPPMGMLLTQNPFTESPLLDNLRYIFWGGDLLTRQDIVRMNSLCPQVTHVNFYGTTETPQAMGYYIVPQDSIDNKEASQTSDKIAIGQGIEGVQLLILNEQGELVNIGEQGEICIRTAYLSNGYLDDPGLTQEKFIINPATQQEDDRIYKTGDLGCYRPDGNVEIIGRRDNQIKLRGFRIELNEIEVALTDHPKINKASVLVHQNSPESVKNLVAYLASNQTETLNSQEIRTFLGKKLPAYMIPQFFVFLASLPLTPNGKVDRHALQELKLEQPETTSYSPPQDEVEAKLAEIWQKWLNQESISIHANFFDLGGHSLLAIRLCSEIEQVFQRPLSISILFQYPTIQQLAAILRDENYPIASSSSIISIQPKGSKLPLFGIHTLGKGMQYYRPLVKYLGLDQPVYGLALDMVDEGQGGSKGVKELADIYIKDMQTLQPTGPYHLIGVSFGGRIAFEMAHKLQAQGEKVAFLGLLDTTARTGVRHLPVNRRVSGHWEKFQEEGFRYIIRKLTSRLGRIRYRLKSLNAKLYKRLGLSLSDDLKEVATRERNFQIKKQHFPQPYTGKLTLFRAMDRKAEVGTELDPQYGWGEIAVGGLEIYDVPGDHLLMLQEPNVQVLAQKITECLNQNSQQS